MVVQHSSLVCMFNYPFPQAAACLFGFLLVTLSKAMVMTNPYVFDRLDQEQISLWSWGTLCFMEIYLILLGTFSCPNWYLQKVLALNNIHIPDIKDLELNNLTKLNIVILFAIILILVICEIFYIVIKYRRTIRNVQNVRTHFVSQTQSVLSDLVPLNVLILRNNSDATPGNAIASLSTAAITSNNAAATPSYVDASPTIIAEPALSSATPTNATATPTNATATPTNATATPTNAADLPTNAADTHSYTAATTINYATPTNAAIPTNATTTPTNAASITTLSALPLRNAAAPPLTTDYIAAVDTPLSNLNTVTLTRYNEVNTPTPTPTPMQLQANASPGLLATNPIRIEQEAPTQPGSSKFISIGLFTIGMYMLLNLVLRFSLKFLKKESPYYFLITVPERLMKQSMMGLILMCSPDVLQFVSKAGFSQCITIWMHFSAYYII